MAYVLGFFAADGTMARNNRGAHFIEFHITDKSILDNIKKVMNSDHKISKRVSKNSKHKTMYRLQIGSKEMFEDLLRLGFMPQKTKVLAFPDIPMKYLNHFIRGYFDGDGCVYFKKHKFSDRKNLKWVFTSRFTCGNKKFLDQMKSVLSDKDVIKGGFTQKKRGGWDFVLSRRDSVALFHFMYNNRETSLFLERKFKLFKKAIETLYDKQL